MWSQLRRLLCEESSEDAAVALLDFLGDSENKIDLEHVIGRVRQGKVFENMKVAAFLEATKLLTDDNMLLHVMKNGAMTYEAVRNLRSLTPAFFKVTPSRLTKRKKEHKAQTLEICPFAAGPGPQTSGSLSVQVISVKKKAEVLLQVINLFRFM